MDQLNEIKIIDFKTESGEIIPSINLTYQLFGKPIGKAPIILINHALTGNSNLTGKNGWWKDVVGKGKAINSKKLSIISFNIPGNGFCSNNFYTPNKFHLGDIANLFLQALEKLNIKKLHAITGGSIGGCLTWEIAAKKPDIAKFIIPVASDWKARDWMIANTYLQDRILNNSRHPVQDARIHAMTFYRSPESFSKRFDRTFNESKGIYNVESWLDHHGNKLNERFNLESYKMMNQLLRSTDITRGGEDFIKITSKINSEIHLICVDSDLFFLPDDDKKTYNLLSKSKKDVFYHEINSIHGHDAFLIETKQISNIFTKIFKRKK